MIDTRLAQLCGATSMTRVRRSKRLYWLWRQLVRSLPLIIRTLPVQAAVVHCRALGLDRCTACFLGTHGHGHMLHAHSVFRCAECTSLLVLLSSSASYFLYGGYVTIIGGSACYARSGDVILGNPCIRLARGRLHIADLQVDVLSCGRFGPWTKLSPCPCCMVLHGWPRTTTSIAHRSETEFRRRFEIEWSSLCVQ